MKFDTIFELYFQTWGSFTLKNIHPLQNMSSLNSLLETKAVQSRDQVQSNEMAYQFMTFTKFDDFLPFAYYKVD